MFLSDKVIYCAECKKIEAYPFCCGKDMELDNDEFFCNICGKEKKLPSCCGKSMVVASRDSLKGVFT